MRLKEIATLVTCLKMSSRARATFRRRLLASAGAALLVCTGVASVDAAVIAIARGGDTAPSASGGATFTVFDEPMVNSRGDVVFEATLSNGDESIYLMPNGGSLTKVVEEGDTVDGAVLSRDFDGPAINDDGTVFFVNRGSTGAFTAAAYMMPAGGTLASIMRQGDPAPGTTGGVFFSFDDMAVNAKKGDFAVIASYSEDGGSTFKVGIWLRKVLNKKKGKFQVVSVVLSGNTLPGTGGGVIGTPSDPDDIGDLDGPWLGENDTVAFAVDNISGSTGPNETGSIWAIKPKGKIRPFILMTDAPPAVIGGTIDSIGVGHPGIVNDKIAALIEVSGGSLAKGIVTKTLSTSTNKAKVLIKPGDPAPGTTGTFTEGLGNPTINSKGGVEFHAEIAGDAANFEGEFVTNAKKKTKNVVLAGDTKPGGGSWVNTEEGSISNKFITFLDDNDDSFDPTVVGVFRASK
jgi:hypothetical protein